MDHLQIFSIVLIATLILARIAFTFSVKLQSNRKFSFFVDYGTTDRVSSQLMQICRILQYVALGLIGSKQNYKSTLYYKFNLRKYCSAENLILSGTMFNYTRKVVRFFKAPLNIKSIKQTPMSNKFSTLKESLISISQYCDCFSDICDGIFYFTDHFELLRIIGSVTHQKLSQNIDTLGNVVWVLGGLFLFISGFLTLVKTKLQHGSKASKTAIYKYSIIKMVSNAN